MQRRKLARRAFGFCLACLLSGCGGSSNSSPSSPLSITTSTLPQGVVNVPYNTNVTASGGITPYGWNVASGSLPPGLALSRAGALSGTPTALGGFTFTVAVADSERPSSVAIASLGITVSAALQVSTTSLPNGSSGVFYSVALAASGGLAPYSWTIMQGSLPKGLTLNATSGVISGTPTASGTSSFTVQVSDAEVTAATASANLGITINPPPARSAALYNALGNGSLGGIGLQIQPDGSMTLLFSSLESPIDSYFLSASPTLPLLFGAPFPPASVQSLLVNPDYSLTQISSASLPGFEPSSGAGPPSVDPAGSNLYLPGPIDSDGTLGVTVLRADGSLQVLSTVAVPNVSSQSRIVFTPDAALAFVATCPNPPSSGGSILSFSPNSVGALTLLATYALAANDCVTAMAVSPDGKYLATTEVQAYSITGDGILTAVLPQPFIFVENQQALIVTDLTWDSSGSYLIASTTNVSEQFGGIAVLSFSGTSLTEIVGPTGSPVDRLQLTGSFVYGMTKCGGYCPYIEGYNFQNGQLTPLPGSPYPYGNNGDMVIY